MRIRERLANTVSLADLEAKGFELADDRSTPSREAERSSLKSCVSGAIDLLPEMYRDVYMRREIMGESAETVALSLQITIPAVKSRLHRARMMVREALDSGLGCKHLADSIS